MKLTILGSSASCPAPHDACSGYLITESETRILIDCGTGIVSSLLSLGLGPLGETAQQPSGAVPNSWGLDAVVISHMHPDHYLDLVPFRYGIRYGKERTEPVNVWVPPGGIAHLRRLGECLSTTQPFFDAAFTLREYTPDSPFTIGGMVIAAVPVWHSIPSYALRVIGAGRTFVYTSDTAPCASLNEVAQDADLLLAETTLGTEAFAPGNDLHLGGPDAGNVARVAHARRLVLTHFWPGTDREAVRHSAMHEFDGVVKIARPQMVMTI